jgi:exonuclease SbcC
MKILKLSFRNLNSLRGSFSIDFDKGPLAESGLFAITGPTGVGKTTILDAITLGLFGKAARYDNKIGSPENVMSRGTGDCFSEVVFSCKSGMYSVRWDLARARKKPDGKVQGAKRQIATLGGDILENKIREVDHRVVELTGLDYNRFLRSVLLAQGRFKEFLDADRNERGELLEKITGTQIYSDLSVAAFGRARDRQAIIDKAKLALEGIRLLDAETIEAHTLEQADLGKKLVEGDKSLKRLTDRIALFDRLIELTKEQMALSDRLEAWEKGNTTFAPETKRIEAYDRASPLLASLSKWKDLGSNAKQCATQKRDSGKQLQVSKTQFQATLSNTIAICERDDHAIEKQQAQQSDSLAKETALLAQINQWLAANQKDEAIEAALPELRLQGEQYRAMAQKRTGHDESIKAIQSRIQKSEDLKASLDAKILKSDKLLFEKTADVKQSSAALRDTLAGNTKLACQEDHAIARERLAKINQLQGLQETYFSESASLKEQRNVEGQETKQLKELEAEQSEHLKSLETQRAFLHDKETIHMQARAIASLKERRGQLKDGEPCDLCGSPKHPYATGALPSQSDTQKIRDAQLHKVDTLIAEEQKQNQALAAAQARRAGFSKACADLERRIADNEKRFSDSSAKMNTSLTVADKEGLLVLNRQEHEQCKRLETLLTAIETNEKSLTEAEKKEAAARADRSSLAVQLKQLEQTATDTAIELEQEQKHVAETTKDLSESIALFCESIAAWLPPCKSPDETKAALAELEARSKTYLENRKRELDTNKQIENSKRDAKRLKDERQRLIREKAEWESKLLAAKMELLVDSPSLGEDDWDEGERRRRSDAAAEAMTRSKSEFNLKETELEKATRELERLSKELHAKALQSGFENLENLDTVLSNREAIDALRLKKRTIENDKLEIATLSNKNALSIQSLNEKHLPNEAEATQLRLDTETARNQQKGFSERHVELRIALEADLKARSEKKEQIDRIHQLEKAARPWLVMRDLIGSADGNLFSRFAQGLTLGQLVAFANQHLQELNPRYLIHRVAEADLELEIIDCYEANAIRPTRSLSGGESFLVSLALALGLSELAGRNTKIESLFIDEGFGSLDNDTLDVALSALENLRLQNRTIGVISHVEDLKIRINTQIQVTRRADGHATLSVVE